LTCGHSDGEGNRANIVAAPSKNKAL